MSPLPLPLPIIFISDCMLWAWAWASRVGETEQIKGRHGLEGSTTSDKKDVRWHTRHHVMIASTVRWRAAWCGVRRGCSGPGDRSIYREEEMETASVHACGAKEGTYGVGAPTNHHQQATVLEVQVQPSSCNAMQDGGRFALFGGPARQEGTAHTPAESHLSSALSGVVALRSQVSG